jgi:Anti-sigma-K factor rskA
MRERTPELDELVGTEVPPAERDRLRGVHQLLVKAGPPPELSPELEKVPWPDDALAPLGLRRREPERRRAWLPLLAAATIGLFIGFFAGQTGDNRSTSIDSVATKHMHGTALARGAVAAIEIGRRGADGNWPMIVTVTNLPSLPNGGYYDLWLSRHGKPIALCGSFNVKQGTETVVRLSAAYSLTRFDGWVITRRVAGQQDTSKQVLLTT